MHTFICSIALFLTAISFLLFSPAHGQEAVAPPAAQQDAPPTRQETATPIAAPTIQEVPASTASPAEQKAAAPPAPAAGRELEEVVVTATRTERPIEEVPAGVSTITEEEIQPWRWDIVVEATGSPDRLSLARRDVRPRGTMVLKSTYKGARRPFFGGRADGQPHREGVVGWQGRRP